MNQLRNNAGSTLAILASLLLVACSDFLFDEHKTMQLARDYLESGDIGAAAIELRNTLQGNPENAEARYLLASIYLDLGDYASADKEFTRAVESGWNVAEATYGRVRSQLGMGEFQDVIKNSRTQESWPASVRAALLCTRALANAALDKREEAFADLEIAQGLDADSPVVIRTGIQLQIVEGRTKAAIAALQRTLEHYPHDPELLLLHAGLVAEDDPAAAEGSYRLVIAQDPEGYITANGRAARLRLVQLQIMGEQFEAATENIKPLYRLDPRDPFTNYLGGVIAFQQGDYEKAGEQLLKVLKLAPEHNPTRLLFGAVNYAESDYEQATYFLSKYVAAVPDNLVARKLLARSYILLGRNTEARSLLQSALAAETEDAELLALAGLSEINIGRTAAGIAGLEQAVKINPDSAVMRIELARAYIDAGESGLAIKELKKMLAAGGEQRQTETLLVLAHLRAGDFSQAIDQVLNMVSRSANDPAVYTLAGAVFATSNDLGEARAYFTRALEMQPGFPPATMSLALAEEQAGNFDQAKLLYEQLVEGKTESVLPMLALARVAEQQNDKAALLGWLERALQHAPTDPRPRIYLAEYNLHEGKLSAAETYIREALEISPGEPALLILSGRVYMARKNYHKALQPLQSLVKSQPYSGTAHTLLGECYLQLAQYDDARRELQAALEQKPDDVTVLALLVKLDIQSSDHDAALAYSRRIQDTYPELFLGYELAGDSLVAGQDYAGAEREYALAWDRMPSARLVIKRADNAGRAGETDTALGLLEDWLRLHPSDSEVAGFLGSVLQTAGRTAEAMTTYEKVIVADPNNAVALNNLAVLYLAENRTGALELAKRAWQAAENNPGVQDTYGWALVLEGQVGRGLQLLEQALKGLPDIPEVRYHHAAALYHAGNRAEARQLLEALLGEDVSFDGREDAVRLLAGRE